MIRKLRSCLIASASLALAVLSLPSTGLAFSIELKGAAPDRIERQRAYTLKPAEDKNVPPAVDEIATRLDKLGIQLGAPAFVRIFKSESTLELWLSTKDGYVLFRSFPVCFWSGTLGPKQREGDKQTPEGFYTLTRRQLHWSARWARSLNIGYPNRLDRRHGRTGSNILIHGGCSSIGCFSMTNRVMSEIHHVIRAAIRRGQRHVPIHIFPFRMTAENMARHNSSRWYVFWRDLKQGHDAFEQAKRPPEVGICGKRYVIRAARKQLAGPIRVLDRRRRTGRRHGGTRAGDAWTCDRNTAGHRQSRPETGRSPL